MAFVIANVQERKYVHWKNKKVELVAQKDQAKKFKEEKAAQSFFESQLSSYFKKDKQILKHFQIMPESSGSSVSLPCRTEKSAQDQTKEKEPETPRPETVSNCIPSSHFDSECSFSLPELLCILSEIPQNLAPLLALHGQVDRALEDCLLEIRYRDKEMCDLAHKAEFSNPNAAEGYRIFKEIHDSRISRRQAKDAAALLQIIRDTGVLTALKQFFDAYAVYCASLENRQYRPRIRPDLFPTNETEEPPQSA